MDLAEQDSWPRTTRRRRRSSNLKTDSAFTSSTDVPEIGEVGRLGVASSDDGGERARKANRIHSRTRTPSPSSTTSRRPQLYLSPVQRKSPRISWPGFGGHNDETGFHDDSNQRAVVINNDRPIGGRDSQTQSYQIAHARRTLSEASIGRTSNGIGEAGVGLNPLAVAVGNMVTLSLSAISPASVCSTFSLLYFCVAMLSLAISLIYSATRQDTSGGFAIGAYVVAVGALLIVPTQSRHQQQCRCELDANWDQRDGHESENYRNDGQDQDQSPVTAAQHSNGMRMLREQLEDLNHELAALRKQQRHRHDSRSEHHDYDSAYTMVDRIRDRPPSVVIAPLPLEEPALPPPASNPTTALSRRSRSRSGGILKITRSAVSTAADTTTANTQVNAGNSREEVEQNRDQANGTEKDGAGKSDASRASLSVAPVCGSGSTRISLELAGQRHNMQTQTQTQPPNQRNTQAGSRGAIQQQEREIQGIEIELHRNDKPEQLLRLERADSGKDGFEEIRDESFDTGIEKEMNGLLLPTRGGKQA